jgi:hypothetical protein
MKFSFKRQKTEKDIANLTVDEETLLTKLNILPDGLYEVQMFDDYEDEPKLKGIKSLLEEKVSIPKMLQNIKELQADNKFQDYHIFSCGHYGSDKEYFIGAIKTTDQYDCLRVFETNGINYNVETKDIIKFFKKWEAHSIFSIIDAYHDRVIIQFSDLNFDLDEFSKEALELCPDFLSAIEGAQNMKKYILDRNGEVDFWWD